MLNIGKQFPFHNVIQKHEILLSEATMRHLKAKVNSNISIYYDLRLIFNMVQDLTG